MWLRDWGRHRSYLVDRGGRRHFGTRSVSRDVRCRRQDNPGCRTMPLHSDNPTIGPKREDLEKVVAAVEAEGSRILSTVAANMGSSCISPSFDMSISIDRSKFGVRLQ